MQKHGANLGGKTFEIVGKCAPEWDPHMMSVLRRGSHHMQHQPKGSCLTLSPPPDFSDPWNHLVEFPVAFKHGRIPAHFFPLLILYPRLPLTVCFTFPPTFIRINPT